MSRLVSRILLSILMFPLATVVYMLFFMAAERMYWVRRIGNDLAFLYGDGAAWAFVAFYWWLLWRSTVQWDSRRRVATLAAVLVALLGGIAVGIVGTILTGYQTFGALVGGISAIALWLIATVLTWRETPAERAKRISASGRSTVTCPTCGYNLTGLSESRCPECGSKFTLDELMAAQPHTAGEIE